VLCLRYQENAKKFDESHRASNLTKLVSQQAFVDQTRLNFATPRSGVGSLFTITGLMHCALSLAGPKINYFILKFYLYLKTVRKSDFV